jgi:hypothetical protein
MNPERAYRNWFRRMAPVHWGEWLERVENPRTRKDLSRLIVSREGTVFRNKGFLRWRRVLGLADRHPDLRTVVKDDYSDFLNAVQRVLRSKSRMRAPELKQQEWIEIFRKLQALLGSHGSLFPSEKWDFHLIDWAAREECTHKVEVHQMELLTPELAWEIRSLLAGWKNEWVVMFIPYFEAPPLKWHHKELLVYPDHFEEHWDKKLLREHLGDRFKW